MTTNYHTPIATGASNAPSTVNTPLGDLDAQITTNTSEIVTARGSSASLNDRLNSFSLADGAVVATVQSTISIAADVSVTVQGGGAAADATSITLSSATNISLYEFVHITLDDASVHVTRVLAIAGAVITIEKGLPSAAAAGNAAKTYTATITTDTAEADSFTVSSPCWYFDQTTTPTLEYGTVMSASGTTLVISTTSDDSGSSEILANTLVGQVSEGEYQAAIAVNYGNSEVPTLANAMTHAAAGIYNVKAYGATGNGATDDTTAIQAAIDAAELTNGLLFLPEGTYITSSTLVVDEPIHMMGAGPGGDNVNSEGGATIKSSASVALQIGETGKNVRMAIFENFQIWTTAGHCISMGNATATTGPAAAGGAVRCTFRNLLLNCDDASSGCIVSQQLGTEPRQFQGNTVDTCFFLTTSSATISPVTLNSTGSVFNSNSWRALRFDMTGGVAGVDGPAVHMFDIHYKGTVSALWNNTFDNILGEINHGGVAWLRGCKHFIFSNVATWDFSTGATTNLSNDMFLLEAGSGGVICKANTFINVFRRDGTLGNYHDWNLTAAEAIDTAWINCFNHPDAGFSINTNNNRISQIVGPNDTTSVPLLRYKLEWIAGQRGKPGLNADIQDSSEAVRMVTDPVMELQGTNAVSGNCLHRAQCGVRITTPTTTNDQNIIWPHTDSNQSAWGLVHWGTENEVNYEGWIETTGSIADCIIWIGLKLTNTPTVATDADQVFVRYEAGVDTNWQVIDSIGGADTTTDSEITVATYTQYHVRIAIDSERLATVWINGLPIVTTTALTNNVRLYPVIGIQTTTNAAKSLDVMSQSISRIPGL